MTIQKIVVIGAPKSGKTALCDALTRRLAEPNFFELASVQIVDSAALFTAAVADLKFGDDTLYFDAVAHHAGNTLTLLTGFAYPPLHDAERPATNPISGSQGTPAHDPSFWAFQQRIDQRLRAELASHGLNFCVVYGDTDERVDGALQTLSYANAASDTAKPADWCWSCDKCSDSACERHLFSRLVADPPRRY
jgi:hypothetical protein